MSKLASLVLFMSITSSITFLNAFEKLYLMPRDSKSAIGCLESLLEDANKSIDVFAYSFTRSDIAKSLRDAAKRGVDVEVIFNERTNKNYKKSKIGYLAKYNNLDVYMVKGLISSSKKYYGSMHIKAIIIDGKTVAFGSANLSQSAFSINYETLFITDNEKLTQQLTSYFEHIKSKATKFE